MQIDTRRWLADRRLTVSIGLTISRAAGDTPSHMLQRADAALYEAKRAGRNCVKQQLPPPEAAAAEVTGSSGLGSPAVARTT
jgi:PleD family two-component response regulator